MTIYKHTQIGHLILTVFFVLLLVVVYSTEKNTEENILWQCLIIFTILGLLFSTLTISIHETYLTLAFGIGIIQKKFLITDIETYSIIKTKWYYGWGIRFTPEGRLYNVSGFDAIRLQMKDGKIYLIGSDEVNKLYEILSQIKPLSPTREN